MKALVDHFNNEQGEGPGRAFFVIVKLQTLQRFVSSCSALPAPVSQHLSWLQRGSEMIRSLGPATSLSSQPVSSVSVTTAGHQPASSYPECQICEAVWVAFSLLPDTTDISSICSLFCQKFI